MELISALQFLKLREITDAWVNDAWDLEFTEIRPLDVDLDEELTARGEHFLNLHKCILKYAGLQQSAARDEASQNIWAYLGENNVPVKSLVAALSFFVLTGKNKKAKVEQRLNSLHAASLYLLLLGMPGSIANKVFHEILFDTCLDLSSHCWPENSGKKRKKDGSKSSKADGKRSRPQRKDLTDMEEEGEEEEEEIHLSGSDLTKIRDALFLLLQSLLKLLQTLSLKDRPQSLSNCTRILSNLLYFEPVIGEIEFAPVKDITKLKCVPEMAFYGLQLLCSPKHGDPKESLRRVFHQLLYVILMMSKGNRKKPTLLVVNQAILSTRDQTISFVSYLVEELKELAVPFLHILLQHICVQMVEKSEFRSHGAQAVSMLTSEMTNTDYSRFIRWLLNFSRHPKMACRLFAVDVAVALLGEPERKPEECQDPGLAPFLQHKLLIQSLLFSGQMDESPTVQGHALSSLAKCLEIPSMNVTQAIHNLFNETGNSTVHEDENTQGSFNAKQKTYRSITFRTVEVGSSESLGSDAKANLALLFRRVKDSRTSVRKSALQALMGLLKHDVIPASSENLFVLSERCRDPAVSVRKKTLQCMGELLTANPLNIAVQKAWLHGVVPVVLDSENTVQDRALEALEQMLLHPITSYSSRSHQDTFQRLAWDLLVLLCQDCKNLCNYLGKAFSIWSKQNKFTPSFITNLISHTEAEHASGAWLLLSKVGSFSARPSLEKIVDAWDRMISSREINVTVCCHILCVIGNIAAHLNEDTKERMIDDLMSRLKRFDMSLEVISAAVDTLFQLGRDEDIKQTQAFLNDHGGELVAACEAYLASVILSENGAQNLNEEQMIKHLHTLGVVSLQCPTRVGKRTVLLVESVLTTNTDKLKDLEDKLPASQPLSQFRANALPTKVRAQGVLTLGKLCLQHEELVQKYLPVFARELEVGTEMAVRNNVVIVMCDLCVRYTAIVDHYVPNISACLRDSEAVIREQALIMLTNLLQEEFVKWKGSLFFRFMVALVDPEPAIASLCKYCLLHLLLKKNPDMFSQHFIECIFHLNCYDKHKSYKFPQSESEKLKFSLRGAGFLDKRFQIYRFLLEHFTDAQRFNLSNKINHSILACFADEELPLDEDGAAILSETFKILSLKEMKLQAISAPAVGGAGEEGEEENEYNMARAVLQTAQRKLVSQVQKKAFIENTVPIITNLKSLLEQKRSTVMKDLMAYLQVIMQDFRSEVKEFFAGDEQLAEELEFALKNAEKNREMEEENCLPAGEARTPTVEGIVLNSPPRARPILRGKFATPQPPRPSGLPTRLTQTERRTYKSKEVSHNRTVQFSFEKTVLSGKSIEDRAISTPIVGVVNLTFEDGTSPILGGRGKNMKCAGFKNATPTL